MNDYEVLLGMTIDSHWAGELVRLILQRVVGALTPLGEGSPAFQFLHINEPKKWNSFKRGEGECSIPEYPIAWWLGQHPAM